MHNDLKKIIPAFIVGIIIATTVSIASAYDYPQSEPPDYGAGEIFYPIHEGLPENVKAGNLGICSSLADNSECLTVGGRLHLYGVLEFWDDPGVSTGVTIDVVGDSLVVDTNGGGGLVIPSASASVLSSAAEGTLIFDTDTDTLKIRINGNWMQVQANP